METARVAALRGHSVTLCEKSDNLSGGQLRLASVAPHKACINHITAYYSTMLDKLNNVKLELGKEITANEAIERNPDVVVVATGGVPLIPDIPGVQKRSVVTAHDVLAGKAEVGENVVVVGGGMVGCETADFLAEQGKRVTIVEMLDAIGTNIESWTLLALKNELAEGDVKIMTGAKLDMVTDDGAIVTDKSGRKTSLEANTVVLAMGVKSVNELSRELEGKVKELYIVGDAKQPRRIRWAISEGYVVAYGI